MKYLVDFQLFESTKIEQVKGFFHDKINWKLITFMEDCLLDYEDRGYIGLVMVFLSNYDKEITISNRIPLYSSKIGYTDNIATIEHQTELYERNNLIYHVNVQRSPDEPFDPTSISDNSKWESKQMNMVIDILKRVRTMFDIEVIPSKRDIFFRVYN